METRTLTYGYDDLNRLTSAVESGATTEGRSSAGAPEQAAAAPQLYTYDRVGNRTDGGRQYDAANQVIGWQYDAAGNLLSDGTSTYTYDALNRVVTLAGITNSSNGAGVLVRQGSTRYVQDLAAPLSQILGDGISTYVYGQERLFALTGSSRTWYATDALGSVHQSMNDSGVVLGSLAFDPWGQVQQGSMPTFGFTGELQQGSNVYLRARWYNPKNGTFTSRDTFPGWAEQPYSLHPYQSFRWQTLESLDEIPYSHHPYQYAYSNPVLNTDPSGMVIPVCPIGYRKLIKDGQFAGCEEDPNFPEWLWFLKGSTGPLPVGGVASGGALPLPQAGGQAAGKALEACATFAVYLFGQLLQVNTQTNVQTQTNNQQPQIFYHYGRHAKIAFILATETIPFSDELANPTRARHGSGVYVTDIAPGTLTKAQIAYWLYGSPHRGNQAHVEAWVAIDTRGMDVIFTGKQHIYRVPTVAALPVAGKIVGTGVTP